MLVSFAAFALAVFSHFGLDSFETACSDAFSNVCYFIDHQDDVAAVQTDTPETPVTDEQPATDSDSEADLLDEFIEPIEVADLEPLTMPEIEISIDVPESEVIEADAAPAAAAARADQNTTVLLSAWPNLSEATRDSILMLIEADLMTQE